MVFNVAVENVFPKGGDGGEKDATDASSHFKPCIGMQSILFLTSGYW